jgi:ribosomal protein S18 acetylase RimI-like enzyme
MKIRKITLKNIDKILELSREFIEEYRKVTKMKTDVPISTALKYKKRIFKKDLKSGHGAIFAMEEEGDFIGYIFVLTFVPGMEKMKKYSSGYISDLHVCKKWRKKGLGIKLVKGGEKWLKSRGKEKVSLDVGTYNNGAVGLYRKLNFKDKSLKLEKKLLR